MHFLAKSKWYPRVHPRSRMKRLVRRWFQQVWNEGRIETVEELLAPDAVIHGLGEQGLAVPGPKAFLSFFATMRSAFPDVHVQVEQVVNEGEWFAARFSASMTYTGGGPGICRQSEEGQNRGHGNGSGRRWEDRRGLEHLGSTRATGTARRC
jgi:predicted SnoaL-like aldol condensation-catalyzing enzyme